MIPVRAEAERNLKSVAERSKAGVTGETGRGIFKWASTCQRSIICMH